MPPVAVTHGGGSQAAAEVTTRPPIEDTSIGITVSSNEFKNLGRRYLTHICAHYRVYATGWELGYDPSTWSRLGRGLINKIPRDQLEEKLGLEVPAVPELSLGAVNSTSVLLHWLGSRDGQAPVTNTIEVNGIKVGEFRQGDTSIEIAGLTPGNCYSIRLVTLNAAGNTASAPVIRVQTGLGRSALQDASASNGNNVVASIRPMSSRVESNESQAAIKENNGAHHQVLRHTVGRSGSMSIQAIDQGGNVAAIRGDGDEDESPDHIRRLTSRLESLKSQKEDIDRQIEEEDLESRNHITELSKERDCLRQIYRDKEEASADLRRHGNHLDKLNRSAQSRKAAKEKQLQQKKAEGQKVKDEIARWGREIVQMKNDLKEMADEKFRVMDDKDRFVDEKRRAISDDQTAIKALEEDIHMKGVQIKALEQKREEISVHSDEERERSKAGQERDEAWEIRYQQMQVELSHWRQVLQTLSMEEQQAKDHLNWWLEKRVRNGEQFAPIASLDLPSLSRSKSRRSRNSNSRASTISQPNYPGVPGPLNVDPTTGISFPAGTPFFNMGNGMAASSGNEQLELSQTEAEILAGGALMSPAATGLLPANLFRDEDVANQLPSTVRRDSSGNNGNDVGPRHTVTTSDTSNRGPNTPVSASSRGGSIMPSPHDSMQNLHGYHSRSDTFDDNDRQSISSIPGNIHPSLATESNPLASNRFANLFSSTFTRQRGKSSGQEPPLLGTLKQGQSHSFPRNLGEDDIDVVNGRRRRGSHGWANPMAGLLARTSTGPDGAGVMTARTSSGRRSRLNMFGSKLDNLEPDAFSDHPPTSRPTSTYSYDQSVTRPSSESQRAMWSPFDGLTNRINPLGPHWAPTSGPWSHVPSRRPSVQRGSTTNLSIGSTPLDPEEFIGPLKKQKSDQAPIGTRPLSSQRPVTPKLNPAAPSFKTLFSRGDSKKVTKQDKSAKLGDKSKEKESEKADNDDGYSIDDASPPNPRLSRDAQSITTATSAADSYDSFDRSTSGTPSEAVTPSGAKELKESLMQKITRKSSSSKFNVPWSKDRAGGGLFSKRVGDPLAPGDIDADNSSEGQLGKSVESASSTPQQEKQGRASISWPNIRRKSRKGDVADKGSEAGEDDE